MEAPVPDFAVSLPLCLSLRLMLCPFRRIALQMDVPVVGVERAPLPKKPPPPLPVASPPTQVVDDDLRSPSKESGLCCPDASAALGSASHIASDRISPKPAGGFTLLFAPQQLFRQGLLGPLGAGVLSELSWRPAVSILRAVFSRTGPRPLRNRDPNWLRPHRTPFPMQNRTRPHPLHAGFFLSLGFRPQRHQPLWWHLCLRPVRPVPAAGAR